MKVVNNKFEDACYNVFGDTFCTFADPVEYKEGDAVFKLILSACDDFNKQEYGFLSYGKGKSLEELKHYALTKIAEYVWNEHYYDLFYCDLFNELSTYLYHVHRKEVKNMKNFTEIDNFIKDTCYHINVYDEFKDEMVDLYIDKSKVKFLLTNFKELNSVDFDDNTGEPIIIIKPSHGKIV